MQCFNVLCKDVIVTFVYSSQFASWPRRDAGQWLHFFIANGHTDSEAFIIPSLVHIYFRLCTDAQHMVIVHSAESALLRRSMYKGLVYD